ncbi:MAG: Smr/MutS family protein, partial [Clostridia bacterium]|nr:Smr/MutS family protein [Clostridia bacterium]
DEQSIEQSLSTFSSHMVNIIRIIEYADNNSLVLLDELGGGTDPIEGAALARAILTHLHCKGAKIAATTHYSELKAYALDTPGVQNACFEFDVETLKPTYKLMVGIPGKSNAFAIAGALGLSSDIINEAKSGISEDSMRFERVAQALETAKKEADKQLNEAAALRLALAREKEKISSHLADLEKKKEQIVAKSREEAARILDNARFQSNQLLNTLEELKKEMNQSNAAEKLSVAKLAAKRGIDDIENLTDPVENNKDENYVLERTPIIGDTVIIISLNKKASVTKVDEKNKKVYVSSGNMNLWINFDDIKLSQKDKKTELPKTRNVSRLKSRSERSVSGEIDIRGMASDEGVTEVDRYIDEAVLAGIETITVIHGKGTGVLRAAVHSHLRRHINVEGFRVGTFGEGENGVTIVTLKK